MVEAKIYEMYTKYADSMRVLQILKIHGCMCGGKGINNELIFLT